MSNSPQSSLSSVVQRLSDIIGSTHVITDETHRKLLSTDLSYIPGEIAEIVIEPANADELGACVAVSYDAGMPVVPRGGGMSYTKGYQPEQPNSLLVDLRRMNKILEINTEDMYVTVQSGVTWKELYEALLDKGVRTPYFGPLSGMYATIGGAISQNSLFLGSGQYNTVAESVIGLKVAMADGSLLQTGSAAHKNGQPFFRHFGPDMTGIFTADTGAFGIKAEATLRWKCKLSLHENVFAPNVMALIPTITKALKSRASRLEKVSQHCVTLSPQKVASKACGHRSRWRPQAKRFCATLTTRYT